LNYLQDANYSNEIVKCIINFNEGSENLLFDKHFKLPENQIIHFSPADLKFFADSNLKIVCRDDIGSGEKKYYLNGYNHDYCQIMVNSITSPYIIEFIKPGK